MVPVVESLMGEPGLSRAITAWVGSTIVECARLVDCERLGLAWNLEPSSPYAFTYNVSRHSAGADLRVYIGRTERSIMTSSLAYPDCLNC